LLRKTIFKFPKFSILNFLNDLERRNSKIEVVDLGKLWNFIVNNFLILNNLIKKNFVSVSKI